MDCDPKDARKAASKRYRERKRAERLGLPIPPTVYNMNRTEEEKRLYKNKLDRKLRSDKTPEEREEYLRKERDRKREANRKWRLKNLDYDKNWARKNPDKVSSANSKYVSSNPDKVKYSKKLWRSNNPDLIKEYGRKYYASIREDPVLLENHKAYRRNYEKARRTKDANYAARCSLRNSFYYVISTNKKNISTTDLIGCTVEEFVKYIQDQFVEGMTWTPKNFHLDHIKPCSSFDLTNSEQIKQCFHYTNFQPLWPKENLEKHAKLDWKRKL